MGGLAAVQPDGVGGGERGRKQDVPAGASRVHTPALVLHGVRIDGHRVVNGGGITKNGERPGPVVRDFAD